MKKEKPLLLNGKPVDFRTPTPALDRLVEFLESLPDGEVFDREHVWHKGAVSRDTLNDYSKNSERLQPLCALVRAGTSNRRYLYGNPRAIKALKKLMEAQS